MSLRNSKPLKFQARGLSDTLDGSNVFPGAMQKLVNLVPDPTTDGQWVCRPAASVLTNSLGNVPGGPWSSGWNPGFGPTTVSPGVSDGLITAMLALGTHVYGMYTTSLLGGGLHDQPFSFNLISNTLTPITGITSGTVPSTLPSSGEWIPPTMTLVGTKIVVCHQGFVAPNYVGYIDIANPGAPTWVAGNLTGAITLTSPPYACGQFNGRAYYLVNPPGGQPAAVFSDALNPRNCTAATQVLTFGDDLLLTAAIGLPLQTTSLGGIIQALLVFKGVVAIYQITGDAATNDLSINALNILTGTRAPLSITPTPKGVLFMSPDGLRLIDFNARISDPIGEDGGGVTVPFIYVITPSRMCAAYNRNTYRITAQNGFAFGAPIEEYWFDLSKQRWTGPHNLTFSHIVSSADTFVGQQINGAGYIIRSDVRPSVTSTFIELGTPMTFQWQSSMLPDTDQMCENAMVETTIFMALNAGDLYSITAVDQNGIVFDSLTLGPRGEATIWGQFIWGQATWGGERTAIAPQQLPWHSPLVFRRLAIGVTGPSSAAMRLGNMHLRYEMLGYLQQTLTGT